LFLLKSVVLLFPSLGSFLLCSVSRVLFHLPLQSLQILYSFPIVSYILEYLVLDIFLLIFPHKSLLFSFVTSQEPSIHNLKEKCYFFLHCLSTKLSTLPTSLSTEI